MLTPIAARWPATLASSFSSSRVKISDGLGVAFAELLDPGNEVERQRIDFADDSARDRGVPTCRRVRASCTSASVRLAVLA